MSKSKAKSKTRLSIWDLRRSRMRVKHQPPQEAIDPNDVMEQQCSTCPWRIDEQGLVLSPRMKEALEIQVFTQSNQICHAPAFAGKPETRICRGARNRQLKMFHQLGVLKEPTDECWKTTLQELTETP